MNQHEKRDVIVGMEPTGHYWLNLAYFLQAYDIQCVTVNPMHVKRSKELDDNSPTKEKRCERRKSHCPTHKGWPIFDLDSPRRSLRRIT
jgi:transposase